MIHLGQHYSWCTLHRSKQAGWWYAALINIFLSLEPVCCSVSGSNCCSWPEYEFLRRQVRWSGIPLSLRIFQFVVIHTVKGFRIVSEWNSVVFFYNLEDIGNLIFGSSAFSKSSLYIWKCSVHILLKPGLKDFEHSLASIWNEHSCMVVWTFFGIWVKTDFF